jgi:hypothetical protein
MIIPHAQLSPETLNGIIEEFVSREGTDYGDVSYSIEQKIAHVRKQLERGHVVVVFDEATESCDLVSVSSQRYKRLVQPG